MQLGELPAQQIIEGVHVTRVECGRQRQEMASPWEGLLWAHRCWPRIRDAHQATPYDITYAHFVMPAGILARRLQRTAGVPYVIIPRGSDVPGYNHERLKLAHWLARPWWRRIVRDAAAVLSPSVYLLDLMRQVEPRLQGRVLPNAIRYARFPVGNKQPRILLCSRLVARKGLQHVLAALSDMDLPGWEVDVVGTGPYEQELRRIAQSVSIPVHFHGWINNRDPRLAQFYGQASIFALPSEAENCPVSILEGMSAGCAVITTNITGNPEVLGDTGTLVPPRDQAAIRRVLEEFTRHPELIQHKGAAAHQRVVTVFAPEVLIPQHLAICSRILHPQSTSTLAISSAAEESR